MKILRRRHTEYHTEYYLSFTLPNAHGGYSFPCDEMGNVDEGKLQSAGLANYRKCLTNPSLVREIQVFNPSYTHPAVGECNQCGAEVLLESFTNTCDDCGTDYNMSGQELAPRECWGEETGESLSDILSIR